MGSDPINPFEIVAHLCQHNLDPTKCARCLRSDLDITAEGGIQSKLIHRPSLLPPKACMLVATILGVKAKEYGEWNWKKIPTKDHLDHLMTHAMQHVAGDRSEFHLGNIACRSLFYLEKFLDENDTQGYDISYLGLQWEDLK